MTHDYKEELLTQHLQNLLGNIDSNSLSLLKEHLEWVGLAAGQTLMTQGEPGTTVYLTISGRMRAYVVDADGVEHMVREMARGEIIGEMSLYTDEPRSATVVAIRDSVLVSLNKVAFNTLLANNAQVSIELTRRIIKRLQTVQTRSNLARPVIIALFPITEDAQERDIAQQLREKLLLTGSVRIVDAVTIDRELQTPGISQIAAEDIETNRRIALLLDEIEAANDYVLLVGDSGPSAWTQRCSRHSDEILLLADATKSPVLHETEILCLMGRSGRSEATETLVLLHPADLRCPAGTNAWLDRRPVSIHVHIRPDLDRDMCRLARIVSCTAVGLVFAGGGARGCAHLGIYRALKEQGIEIDFVGGTSIGSAMACFVASDQPLEMVMQTARKAFSVNPTGDFNAVPLLSLISGRRLKRVVAASTLNLLGNEANLEDLWKNFFCVASNYSQATEHIMRRGNLIKSVLASTAIPGALPPVLENGDLLFDGGTFNNFPVDIMRSTRGVGQVIGVDLSFGKPRRIELEIVPSGWALFLDYLRPRSKRRYKFPSLLSYLMNVTILYSKSRQHVSRALTDLYFNPPLHRVGMLQWTKFDDIVQKGYIHGQEVLGTLSPSQLKPFMPQHNSNDSGKVDHSV